MRYSPRASVNFCTAKKPRGRKFYKSLMVRERYGTSRWQENSANLMDIKRKTKIQTGLGKTHERKGSFLWGLYLFPFLYIMSLLTGEGIHRDSHAEGRRNRKSSNMYLWQLSVTLLIIRHT